MKIISVANQKGGVGKTTTTMALGAALAARGKRVVLIDLDPQGNLSSYLGFEPDGGPTVHDLIVAGAAGRKFDAGTCIRHSETEQLDYIPATLALGDSDTALQVAIGKERVLYRSLQAPAFVNYDYAVIDCRPALDNLTLNALSASDTVIVPVQMQKFALDGLDALFNSMRMIKQLINPDLKLGGILRTMRDNTNMCDSVDAYLRERYGDDLYNTSIRRSVEAANSTAYQRSLVSYKNKLGPEYEAFAEEFLAREGAAS